MRRSFIRFLAKIRSPVGEVKPHAASPAPKPEPQLGLLLQKADALRDAGSAATAAVAYREVLTPAPGRSDVRV